MSILKVELSNATLHLIIIVLYEAFSQVLKNKQKKKRKQLRCVYVVRI